MTLGERLARLRTQRGLSQDALAEALGVSRQSVSKWETDASIPELDKLVKLSDLFEISLDALVRGDAAPAAPAVPARTPEKIPWPQRAAQLYRGRAYLLGWLLAAWGIWGLLNATRVICGYALELGWENAVRFLQVSLSIYILHALKLGLGLFLVFRGRRFAGRFRWYHLGWVLVTLGLFGLPSVRFLRSGPLETLLTGLLLFLPYYGVDRMLEYFSLWPEELGNLLLCALGALLLIYGERISKKEIPRS